MPSKRRHRPGLYNTSSGQSTKRTTYCYILHQQTRLCLQRDIVAQDFPIRLQVRAPKGLLLRTTAADEVVPSKRCHHPGPANKTGRDLSRSSSLSASDSSSYPSFSSYSSERSTNNLGSSDSTSATPHSTPTYTLTSRLRMPAKQLHQKHLQTPQKDQPSQGIRFRYVALVPTNDCCSTNT